MPKKIIVTYSEEWDPVAEEFISNVYGEFTIEHSLISISKWEQKWKKPFSSREQKTPEEILDYIKCMTITPNVKDSVYAMLSNKNIEEIFQYMNDPMTATTISNRNKKHSRQIVTSELIYSWMFQLSIPIECQKWHFNRLMTLIEVCSINQEEPKKMSSGQTMRDNAALNAARRAKHRSKG